MTYPVSYKISPCLRPYSFPVEFRAELLALLSSTYLHLTHEKLPVYTVADNNILKTLVKRRYMQVINTVIPNAIPIPESNSHERVIEPTAGSSGVTASSFTGEGDLISVENFDLLTVLGRGSFGKVMLVCKRDGKDKVC